MDTAALLTVRNLQISFGNTGTDTDIAPVRGLSFDVHPHEVLALVGESGAGKSLTARALLGMTPRGATVTGSVRRHARRITLVPQDALSALSPVHPVGDQLATAVRSATRTTRREAHTRAITALDRAGIPNAARNARAYPHEYSGGMRQRAVIAMATINEPDVVVADEPTTALDAELQEQILQLLAEQREALGAALVLVTHDLNVVREHADRALVMYAGRQVELGSVERVLGRPRSPYTAGLLASLPPSEPENRHGRRLPTIPGTPPHPAHLPPGCPFAPRCPLAEPRCHHQEPEPRTTDGREVSCHRWDEVPYPATELYLDEAKAA